jgi:hypothetical protein
LLVTGCGRSPDAAAVSAQADVPEAAWRRRRLDPLVTDAFELSFSMKASARCKVRLVLGEPSSPLAHVIEFGPEGTRVRTPRGADGRFARADARTLAELAGRRLTYERRPYRWRLALDGDLMVAGDAPPPVGAGISFLARDGELDLERPTFREVGAAYFTDSFMRASGDPSAWREAGGAWELLSLSNPLLSSNAFRYRGAGVPFGASIVGEPWWSDLSVSVACRPEEETAVGLYFCYRDPDNHYLFRWTTRDTNGPVRQVVRRRQGVETVLAEAPGGCLARQWYTLKLLIGAGWVRVGADDDVFFTVSDRGITSGKIGLYVESEPAAFATASATRKRLIESGATADQVEIEAPLPGAVFDDVAVEQRPARLLVAEAWRLADVLRTGGDWMALAQAPWDVHGATGGMAVLAEREARLTWGEPAWPNYRLATQLGPWTEGTLGLVLRYSDEANYHAVEWTKAGAPKLALVRVRDGKRAVLADCALPGDALPHDL